jgi:hypothetical protein
MGGSTVGSSLMADSPYLFFTSCFDWSREKSRMSGSAVGSFLLADSSYLGSLLLLWLVQRKV